MSFIPRTGALAGRAWRFLPPVERTNLQTTSRRAGCLAEHFTSPRTTTAPSTRNFSSSPSHLKKRKIAAPSNSHKSSPAPSSSSSSSSPSADANASQPSPEDPLDLSSVTAAYTASDVHFKALLQTFVHGGRFNPDNLGAVPIPVKADDGTTTEAFPLRELAQIVPRSGRTISLLVNDRAYIKPIIAAVQASKEFNQQPQRSDDNELELLLKVELERKDDIVRRIKEATQNWRDRIRQARNRHEKALKEWKKTGAVLPDVAKKVDKELQKLQDKKMKEIDQDEAGVIKQIERNAS